MKHHAFRMRFHVWVAEWPFRGKKLLTRLTIHSLCMLTICNSGMSRFGFEGGIRILIAQAPGNCILVTSNAWIRCRLELLALMREGDYTVLSRRRCLRSP